jgi:hypothetical protein
MTDELLLVFGCGVSFLALSGAWVFLRSRLLETSVARSYTAPPREAAVLPPAKT